MKKRRILAFILSLVMIFSNTIVGFAEESDGATIDASTWTPEDFTYTSYEKLLYGCDYTRQITIKGSAIAGFSESGEAKLALNTDLVLPAVDDEGYAIVGVADNAFKNKGLTSVQFPTGMMVDYDDTITNKVTKRGNFIIADSAFAGNNLTSVTLPEGVIAVLPYAFNNNKLETVKLPKTIWWLETMSFANNKLTNVSFPTTCDFQLEMHGMVFAKNFIKSVRLPDYTEVVNKDSFFLNTGKEPIPADAKDSYKTYKVDGETYEAGVVYMYTDNAELEGKDRIHHMGKSTSSQYSYVQKLVVNDGSDDTQNTDLPWNISDFTYEGTVITGLSESGIAKRVTNKDLVIPELNREGQYITEIASSPATSSPYGLFGAGGEGFDSVYLPSRLVKIGDWAFRNNGLKDVTFPSKLETIGMGAFQTNQLTSVILPDTVTSLGGGAFGTNPKLERISLSKGLTVIPNGAFGCSDADNYMKNLTSIELHEGITEIGQNAFAGNNFHSIVIPSTVKKIGNYAFSTKEYLTDPCTLTLNEGLETIGSRAFRNKTISEVVLPKTVTSIKANSFEKVLSSGAETVVTKIYVSLASQYEDTKKFPASAYHKIILTDVYTWTPDDFTYGIEGEGGINGGFILYPADKYSSVSNFNEQWVVTGFSESGAEKIKVNTKLEIPAVDPNGRKVQGIGDSAFKAQGITELVLPKGITAPYDDTDWGLNSELTERGDFFIGASAFYDNKLTSLEIPEGVIQIGGNAFGKNKLTSVILPKTVMQVSNQAFARNEIKTLVLPEKSDLKFQVDAMAFALNNIEYVQFPSNTQKLDKNAFGNNKNAAGTRIVVQVYINTTKVENLVVTSSTYHKVTLGNVPVERTPWGMNDFTYDEAGTTITGLSESGQAKIKVNPALVLPKEGPTGEAITALADGIEYKKYYYRSIFEYVDDMGTTDDATDDKYYAPASIVLPSTLTKIGNRTFMVDGTVTYESQLTEIKFPEGLVEIGQMAFQGSKLTSVSLPDSVTTIGIGAFSGSNALTSIKLSASLIEIPNNAFINAGTSMASVKDLVIPEGVTSVGASAFAGRHIETLTLPSTLQTIGNKAFENHQLKTLVIPASVTKIGDQSFRVYQEGIEKTLEKLTLNEGLVTIGKEAFLGSKITELELPSTVVLSAKNKAADCIFGNAKTPASPIVKLYVADESKVETFNTKFANDYSHIVVYDNLVGSGWTLADFTFDEATGTITGWSEAGHAKRATLKALVLPDKTPESNTVVAVGDNAFKIPDDEVVITKFGIDSPEGMTSVVIPSTVTKLGEKAFAQNALTEVDLTGLTEIGARAFYGNDLVKAIIPDTVTLLGEGAFATNDITELKLSSAVTVIPQGAFSMNIRLESVEIPNTVTEIGETAFAGARLTSLTIPESVTKIGRKAFHLHHLSELTIPGNVKEIGESAFEGTYKATTLKSLTIEEGVEVIGKYAFKEALLETVLFPNSIKEVGEKPFLNNSGKDGSHVVEVTTYNIAHEQLEDDTYVIRYLGDYEFTDYEDLVELEYAAAMYTGEAYEPTVSIPGLTAGEHYTVEYKNNVEVGTATVVLTGLGQYVGTIEKTFEITDNPLVKDNEELKAENSELKHENEILEAEKEALEAENAALKAEIKKLKDQMNSHKCPVAENTTTESEKTEVVTNEVVADVDDTEDANDVVAQPEDDAEDQANSDVKNETSEEDAEDDALTVGADSETGSGNDNKFLIGLVIGLIAGGSVCYLVFGKKKKEQA